MVFLSLYVFFYSTIPIFIYAVSRMTKFTFPSIYQGFRDVQKLQTKENAVTKTDLMHYAGENH